MPPLSVPWIRAVSEPLNPLLTSTTADVCIIGAGVAGLSVAYECCLRGARVVVLDQWHIGRGQTARTTAHLVTALDERYFEIERLHDAPTASLARQSHAAAIDRIESIARAEGIRCGFSRVEGYLFVPGEFRDPGLLIARELDAARRAGVDAEPLRSTPGLLASLPCLHFPRQAQLQPLLYLDGLARSIRVRGGRVHTGTGVAAIDASARPVVHTADNLRIHAGAVVIASNTTLREHAPTLPSQTPFRSYVAAVELEPGAMEPALYWDGYWEDETPYHYVRLACSALDSAPDLLVVGGEDEPDQNPGDEPGGDALAGHAQSLQRWAAHHFPGVGRVVHQWYGRILEPDDELAFIGRLHDDAPVYLVSGDSGNGMTYAAIAGMILPELIAGRDHPWAAMYSPRRRRNESSNRRARAHLARAHEHRS